MPQVVMQLLGAMEEDDAGVKNLERIIKSDLALTSRVLGLANSAYYGCSQKITTIQRAVVVIGFHELRLLAMGTGLSYMFDITNKGSLFDGQDLWSHCLAVSWLSKTLAETARHKNPDEVMLSGFLHDLGKLVMLSHLEDESNELALMVEKGIPYYQAEEQSGIDHSTIGFWLAKKWGLPKIYIHSIQHHHNPMKDDSFFQTTNLVCLSDLVAKGLNYGLVQESRPLDLRTVAKAAGLTSGQVKEVVKKAEVDIPRLLDSWGISG